MTSEPTPKREKKSKRAAPAPQDAPIDASTDAPAPVEKKKKKKEKKPKAEGDDVVMEDAPAPAPASPSPKKKRKRDEEAVVETAAPADEAVAPEGDEVPVLSHAAQRKAKKAKTTPSTDTPASTTATAKPTVVKSEAATKRQNSVWVGNLSFKTTSKQLQEFFQFAGEVTRVHLPTKVVVKPGDRGPTKTQNRGFAYVDFANPEGKATAITYSERNLDGRRLLIKDGSDFEGRPIPEVDPSIAAVASASSTSGQSKFAQKVLRAQKQPAGPTLFVGNLGFEATAESVREMIEAHERVRELKAQKGKKVPEEGDDVEGEGEEKTKKAAPSLRKVRMGTFEDSGLCKGFAFLDFISPQHATAALIDPRNYSLDGRDLKLEFASPDAVRRGGNSGPKRREGNPKDNAAPGEKPSAKPREKPGVALANAHREKVGIVESTGVKITF